LQRGSTKRKEQLCDYLNSVDYDALNCAVQTKIAEQSLPDSLSQFTDV